MACEPVSMRLAGLRWNALVQWSRYKIAIEILLQRTIIRRGKKLQETGMYVRFD